MEGRALSASFLPHRTRVGEGVRGEPARMGAERTLAPLSRPMRQPPAWASRLLFDSLSLTFHPSSELLLPKNEFVVDFFKRGNQPTDKKFVLFNLHEEAACCHPAVLAGLWGGRLALVCIQVGTAVPQLGVSLPGCGDPGPRDWIFDVHTGPKSF